MFCPILHFQSYLLPLSEFIGISLCLIRDKVHKDWHRHLGTIITQIIVLESFIFVISQCCIAFKKFTFIWPIYFYIKIAIWILTRVWKCHMNWNLKNYRFNTQFLRSKIHCNYFTSKCKNTYQPVVKWD